MIATLVGILVIVSIIFLFYITGKIGVIENDNEDGYIWHGFAIWVVIGLIGTFCYVIGKIILHFI